MTTDTPREAHQSGSTMLTAFFEGQTTAWGIFEDRFGRKRRHFTVDMYGRWAGGVFVLEERFTYDTGETETRVWRVTPGVDGRFTATTEDCVGQLEGSGDESSVRMAYRFRLPVNGRTFVVSFDDRIHRLGDGIAVNRATMTWWGFRVGELSLFFQHAAGSNARTLPERPARAA